MEAGRLRHRIILQKPIEKRDSYGGTTEGWETVVEVWAEVRPMSGKEYIEAARVNSEATTRFFIRYRADVRVNWSVFFKGERYQINEIINPYEANRQLQLLTTAVKNAE